MACCVIVDFNRSSLKNGIFIEMPSCWQAIIPTDKVSLIRQEEYVDDDENTVLEIYLHMTEPVGIGRIERVRLPNIRISDLEQFFPEHDFIPLLTDSDVDYDDVVPCLISKRHIADVKDKDGSIVQINVLDSVVVSLCLATYQITNETRKELDVLFSKETDEYGWRRRMPLLA